MKLQIIPVINKVFQDRVLPSSPPLKIWPRTAYDTVSKNVCIE